MFLAGPSLLSRKPGKGRGAFCHTQRLPSCCDFFPTHCLRHTERAMMAHVGFMVGRYHYFPKHTIPWDSSKWVTMLVVMQCSGLIPQITRSSHICWWLNQRRSMPCLTLLFRTATSKPSRHSVTWLTESWWLSLDGQSIFQVSSLKTQKKHHGCSCLQVCMSHMGGIYLSPVGLFLNHPFHCLHSVKYQLS